MKKSFICPNDHIKDSDSKTIQAAIEEAVKCGCNRIKIPAYNKRTDSFVWIIDEAILIPSHFCVELDNAHLRLEDGVYCQIFTNSLSQEEIGKTANGEQEDISIIGYGKSVLDGGKHNGLREKTPPEIKATLPHIMNNLTIYLHNVKNFKIQNLTIRDQRWWGLCFCFCSFGVISDIHYELTDLTVRESNTHLYRNQDGIDLRVGCHDIDIRNIEGETGDDIVALTALGVKETSFERKYYCDHLSPDIYNVNISNIRGFNCYCALVRLLCHMGRKIYNININNLFDTTPDRNELLRTASCVKLGENDYCNGENAHLRCKHGEMHDINVSNVFSNALTAIVFNCSAKNVTARNIYVGKRGKHAVSVSKIKFGIHTEFNDPANVTTCENILIDGVNYHSEEKHSASVCFFDALIAKNFKIANINYPAKYELETISRPQVDSEKVVFENVVAE